MAVLLLEGCLWEVQHLCLLQCCEEYTSAQPYPDDAWLPALQKTTSWLHWLAHLLHINSLLMDNIFVSEEGTVQG